MSSLFAAIASGDRELFGRALKAAPDVNELGPEKRTPLIEAAAAGRMEMVKALLDAGAEPSWRDDAMETALLKGAANGHSKVVALLIGLAGDDERHLALSFLAAHGKSNGPEFQYDVTDAQRRVASVAARAANFVGHEEPLRRLERLERAEKKRR